jgi:hypothetical protein
MLRCAALSGVVLGAGGCTGEIGGEGAGVEVPTAAEANEVGANGARRLSAVEYRLTVLDLLGVDVTDAALVLPTDERTPFDNELAKQTASQALIDGVEVLASEIAGEVVASPELRAAVVPCEPSGPADEACFRAFVTTFGRRALRRTVSDEEVDAFASRFMPHAATENDFWIAVDSALRAFLQHPEFLYRIEIGEPVPGMDGLYRLTDFQVATRLSYFLWGSGPPDWLLDAAEARELTDGGRADPARLREAAATMLADERALARIARFHAMWLSYESLPHAAPIAAGMELETTSLLQRVLLDERRAWIDLLRADQTFLTPELAAHYGLPAPAGGAAGWVSYGDSGRRGILSHGSFLSAVPKFDDTSPTQRGLLIRTRLFCMDIEPPPPELGVNVDEPPGAANPDACKVERYSMWQTDGCKVCHAYLEPVGFGLENFDAAGRFRATEPDKPECTIDGAGSLEGVGQFNGPAQLGELMIQSGEVDACVATMLYRYATGKYELDEHDAALLERLVEAAKADGDLKFDTLISEYVASEAFTLRRDEEVASE